MNSQKVALVTGASRGIGRTVAKGLAEDGYDLILIARNYDQLVELSHEIKNTEVSVKIIARDISETDDLLKDLDSVLNEFGQIDVLVNNAGIFIGGTLETSLDDYQKIFDVNFTGQLVLLKAIIPRMQKQNKGYVFNIASLAGKVGYSSIGAYTSTKFALVGLTESLQAEFGSQGIKITSICPSWVATDMAKGAPISELEMIQTRDILYTIRWLLQLSPGALVNEVIIHTKGLPGES